MDNETQNKIAEIYAKLPADIKQAIASSNYKQKLTELFRKYQLHVDQAGALETETSLVMLGITHPNDFVGNLKENLNILDDKARLIAKDVNDMIFLSIRASLMKMHEEVERGETPKVIPPQPQPIPKPSFTPQPQITPKPVNMSTPQPFQKPAAPTPPAPVQKFVPPTVKIPPTQNPVEKPSLNKPPLQQPIVSLRPQESMAGQKTTSIVKVPSQEITLREEPKTPQTFVNPIKKQYTVDPYREPLK